MNSTPIVKVNEDGPAIGVAVAQLLLQHALETEKQAEVEGNPDLARKRAINELTGASTRVPPIVPAATPSDVDIATRPLKTADVIQTNSAYD